MVGGKGVAQGCDGQEREFARDLSLTLAEPTRLFTFLADDRRDQRRHFRMAALSKALDNILQDAHIKIGDPSDQRDRFLITGHREDIVARLDGLVSKGFQRVVCQDGVELLLLSSRSVNAH